MEKTIYCIIISLCFIACNSKKQSKSVIIYKNYSFCRCMYFSEGDSKKLIINDGSTGVYTQNDSLKVNFEDNKLDEFISEKLQEYKMKDKYQSFNNSNLTISKCLDIMNSRDLEEFIIDNYNE